MAKGRDPGDRISLCPNPEPVCIRAGGRLIASTRAAVELRETGYPHRQYIPREDVDMAWLVRSDTLTQCPFKGTATYYSIRLEEGIWRDAAWSYESPYEAMAGIKGLIAFAPAVVQQLTGADPTQ